MKKRLLTVPAMGALLAFGAVACGGDNTEQLSSWAKRVCEAAQAPITQSQAALADTGKVQQGESPADLQKRLSTDLGALAKTNQQLADAIDKAGAPKVDSGDQVQQGAVGELKQAAQGYLDVQKKLNALPNGDQARFADGLRSVGDQVQRLAQQSTEALNKIQSGDLGTAMAKQPGCKAGAAAPAATGTSAATPAPAETAGGSASPSAAAPGSSAPAPAASSGAPSAKSSGSRSASPSASPSKS
ncbi:hypothetical protein GCM10010193_31770 [Kitasatospora atroaurantiaca]|uniref:Small secreted protein n=1 Tax=Kitasatospora atroaurantiaca TaxID=285545 RepID=A0A561ERC3_9ACTN|nr:hypothetical protein [Kitasatospora atroaurantiaca]TWE18162.1 hypothetical protein FB465_3212 [Kitasatospora atroaurantiaca]